MYFVPEGQHDRSLARSAWNSATPKEPSRRVRYDLRGCAHRFEDWREEISNAVSVSRINWQRAMAYSASVSGRHAPLLGVADRTSSDTNLSRRVFSLPKETRRRFRREIPVGSAAPDHTVPYGTVRSRDAFPGTSCLATISCPSGTKKIPRRGFN